MNPERMRIAMLGHKRIPSREGGIEVVVEELSVRMAARGHEVTCLNRAGHHVSGAEFDADIREAGLYRGVRLKTVPTLDRRGFAAMTASVTGAFQTLLRPYDVVHFHAEGPCAMLWLPKLFGKRCVATIHGIDWQRSKWGGFASRFIRFGEKTAVRHADTIIVLSRGVQEYFRQTYGRETVFIPNGVTRPERCPAEEITARFGLEKDGYVLFLGRIVPEKGLHYLLEAWKGLQTEKTLVIAGDASDTAGYYDEMKKRGGERVLFTGFVQGRALAELYSNAYLYCLPSDLEGMPLSLLEAMSYGNCCVVSSIPECTEVVGDRAVVFEKSDAADLRKKLQTLLDDPKRVESFREKAADCVCAQYDWEDVVEKTLAVYRGETL